MWNGNQPEMRNPGEKKPKHKSSEEWVFFRLEEQWASHCRPMEHLSWEDIWHNGGGSKTVSDHQGHCNYFGFHLKWHRNLWKGCEKEWDNITCILTGLIQLQCKEYIKRPDVGTKNRSKKTNIGISIFMPGMLLVCHRLVAVQVMRNLCGYTLMTAGECP